MEFATIPIIVAICGIFSSLLKLFTKDNEREDEILAAVVPFFGSMFTLLLYFIHSDYMLEFADPLVAIMIGFVSGQAALETKSTFDTIKSKKELKDLVKTQATDIIKENQDVLVTALKDPEVITEIVTNSDVQNIIEKTVENKTEEIIEKETD